MYKALIIPLLALVMLAGCRKEHETPPADRTVIVYLCADNNLSAESWGKIGALQQGMKQMGKTRNNLIVYSDPKSEMPKLWKVTESGTTLLKEYTERNSASAANFNAVLSQVAADFPAESYGLICFSHASGWLPKGALNDPDGFTGGSFSGASGRSAMPSVVDPTATRTVFDDNGSEMDIDDFAAAIPPFPGGKKLEFIVFEACYMASVEVAWSLRNKTRYIVASAAEMLSDGLVGIYPEHLADLFAKEPDLKGFCKAYFDRWNARSGALRSATVSLINTARIDELAQAVSNVAAGDPLWTGAIDPSTVQHFNRNPHHLFFDLGEVVEKTASTSQFAAFADAMSHVVEYQAATPGFMLGDKYPFTITRHSGLTTYIPQEAFPRLNAAYQQTAWHVRLFAGE